MFVPSLLLLFIHSLKSWILQDSPIRLVLILSISVLPTIFLRTFISFASNICLIIYNLPCIGQYPPCSLWNFFPYRFFKGVRTSSSETSSWWLLVEAHFVTTEVSPFPHSFLLPSWRAVWSYRPHLDVRYTIWGDDWSYSLHQTIS